MLLAVPMISQANITEPEIYGRVVMTGQYQKDKGESTTQLASHSSRFGIKGNHDISENVKATYQLEYGINPFTSTTFSDRNQFVGLTGDWGLATMGRRDTAMKNASTGVHHFNAGGMDAILSTIMNGENRADQQISYRSPVIANLVRAEFTYLPRRLLVKQTRTACLQP
ncbi:outer membrane protein [Vibrio astriarenae]|nr:outer membrane protein [Vibrio sp. C7]